VAFADPKWLEILKASGGQSAAASLACGVLLLVGHWGWLPPLDPWIVQVATFGLLLFGFLAIASLVTAINKNAGISEWITYRIERRQAQEEVRGYIPFMTQKEREIIGYLLAKNQKTLEADTDGGYANTLISRRIIILYGQKGQQFRGTHTPMIIPDHVWEVLVKHKSEFPYTPPRLRPGETEPHPWRINWAAR
jgi:Super-infection exclusion protein B